MVKGYHLSDKVFVYDFFFFTSQKKQENNSFQEELSYSKTYTIMENDAMEIVNIDADTFERMLLRFETFCNRLEHLCSLYGDKDIEQWLDNQDVCLLLNISPRTLQTLRDNGILSYSRINHKIYYKTEDIKKVIPLVEDKRKEAFYKGKKI